MAENALQELAEVVAQLDIEKSKAITQKAIDLGISPHDIINNGLAKGMDIVSKKYDEKEYFLPDLMMAAECVNEAFKILKPHLDKYVDKAAVPGKVVIGTVQGDIHEIGKNIVVSMFIAAGFDVYDLGVDVPPETFMEKAKEVNADIVASSALLTTTMPYQEKIERTLREAGIRNRVKTMIGGLPTSREWAERIGADAWGKDALEAVEKAKELIKRKEAKK